MEPTQFIQDAIRTESVVPEIKVNQDLLEAALGAFISSGLILDQLKRQIYYGSALNEAKIQTCVDDLDLHTNTMLAMLYNGNVSVNSLDRQVLENVDTRLIHGMIGICTEAAEMGQAMQQYISDPDGLDVVNVQEELFDGKWYSAIIHNTLELDWNQTLQNGINKLKVRFPDKFSNTHALQRDLESERIQLERPLKTD